LLQGISERGAWKEWLLFFLGGLAESARDASSRAKQLQDLQVEWRAQLQVAGVSGLTLRILDRLFVSPVISPTSIRQDLKVSHQGASKALQRLTELGILQEITDQKRNKLYLAGAIVRIVA